jgi:hypothetical protein
MKDICNIDTTDWDDSSAADIMAYLYPKCHNCIAFMYDSQLRVCRILVKGIALKMDSCTAPQWKFY